MLTQETPELISLHLWANLPLYGKKWQVKMANNYTYKVRKKDDINRVIKRFIKKCKKLGIIDEIKDRQHYTKPSEKKRRAKERAIRRRKKEERKNTPLQPPTTLPLHLFPTC